MASKSANGLLPFELGNPRPELPQSSVRNLVLNPLLVLIVMSSFPWLGRHRFKLFLSFLADGQEGTTAWRFRDRCEFVKREAYPF